MKQDTFPTEETVALTRFRAVNHIEELIRGGGSLAGALREASLRTWPDEGGRCYAVRTLEDWVYAYRKGGFPALQAQVRTDKGTWRMISDEFGAWLMDQVSKSPELQVTVLYEHWTAQGMKLPSKRSVYRYLERQGLSRRAIRAGRLESGPTKTFEAGAVNELWMVDFSPGPTLRLDGKAVTTQLCVILDDYSRLITFAGYYLLADTRSFHHAYKEAIQRRGLPRKLYTDRGGPFINTHTRLVCANLGVRLLHAKPYHAWSKGKVERVIQTIQKGFEATLSIEGNHATSVADLNHRLSVWIQTVYHTRAHGTTGLAPLVRYQKGIEQVRHLDRELKLEELFYARLVRRVRKDGTVRIKRVLYEVPLSLRALAIELRFDPFIMHPVEVWHQGRFIAQARRANVTLNGEGGGSRLYDQA